MSQVHALLETMGQARFIHSWYIVKKGGAEVGRQIS